MARQRVAAAIVAVNTVVTFGAIELGRFGDHHLIGALRLGCVCRRLPPIHGSIAVAAVT